MQTLDTYIGIEPFTVLVNASPELIALAERARQLRRLPFPERLEAVKRLTLDAMVNAYEAMHQPRTRVEEYEVLDRGKKGPKEVVRTGEDNSAEIARFEDIVRNTHPLSRALRERAGCCRYQGALFFVLGYEADLGDRHFIHAAPLNGFNTVFNEVVQGEQSQKISIFRDSVSNPRHDYTRLRPNIFEEAFAELLGHTFYSYHRTPNGLVLVANLNRHVMQL